MDLNQTTTISRRKTFTVPVPVGVRVLEVSSNQTFTSGELGDQTKDNISKQSSSKGLISNMAATAETDVSLIKSILGDNGLWKCAEPNSLLQDEDIKVHFKALMDCRNSRFPSFEAKKKDLNVSGAKVHQSDAALDMELERLRQQERILKDDVNKQISMIKLLEGRSKAEEEKIMAQTKELQRKALRNKTLRTDISAKNEELKEEIRNVTSMTKDLVDRLNYPKAIIRTLLKVSSENRCEDEDFCREFSDGGKCSAATNMESHS